MIAMQIKIDLVNESRGSGARVAVALGVDPARDLVNTIQAMEGQTEKGGYVNQ